MLPTSKFPAGFPNSEIVKTYRIVGIKAIKMRITAPKYFPKTICFKEIGLVSKSSIVPIFISSLKARMHTAGIKNSNIQGASSKKGERSANPESRILKLPLKTQRNKPFITKKTAITKYPMVLEKKEFISRFIIEIIYFARYNDAFF